MATQLPTVEIQGVTYYVDKRLEQLRAVDNPHNTRSFDELEDTQPEDKDHNRVGVGIIPCKYCEDKDCNFDCDESQAGGFN